MIATLAFLMIGTSFASIQTQSSDTSAGQTGQIWRDKAFHVPRCAECIIRIASIMTTRRRPQRATVVPAEVAKGKTWPIDDTARFK
jgi:ribosomal protein L34E